MGVRLCLVAASLLTCAVTHAAPPEDVASVKKYHSIIIDGLAKPRPSVAAPKLVEAGIALAHGVIGETGLQEFLTSRDMKRIDGAVEEFIKRLISGVENARDGKIREAKIVHLLSVLTSTRWFENFLAKWLGFIRVGKLREVAILPKEKVEKVVAEPENQSDHALLDWQGVDWSARGAFRPLRQRSKVIKDVGGPGSNNGRIDSGEWVKLSIALENKERRRMFSASAWLESKSPCVWVDGSTEYELKETSGERGLAVVEPWIFVSSQCTNSDDLSFGLTIKDSHLPDAGAVTISFTARRPSASLAQIMFDTDKPGFSDGSNVTGMKLLPGMSFELATDLRVKGIDANSAYAYYAFQPAAKELVRTADYALSPLQRAEGGLFVASDDVDIRINSGSRFSSAASSLARPSRVAQAATDGQQIVWVAIEFAAYTQQKLNTLVSRREVRMIEVKAPAPAPEPEIADTVPVSSLPALIRQFLVLKPLPARPASPNGVAAANGYEVVLDEKALRKALAGLRKESDGQKRKGRRDRRKKRGGAKLKSVKVEVKPKVVAEDVSTYRYVFRFYVPFYLPTKVASPPTQQVQRVVAAPRETVGQHADSETVERYPRKVRQMTRPNRTGCACATATGGESDVGGALVVLLSVVWGAIRRRDLLPFRKSARS